MKLQRLGGYSAIAYVWIPFCVLFLLFYRYGGHTFNNDPVKYMDEYATVPNLFLAIGLLLIICSILFLITILALHERMQVHAPLLTGLILIAASAVTVILIIYSVITLEGSRMITPTHDVAAYRALLAINAGLMTTQGLLSACTYVFIGCAVLITRSLSGVLGWLYFLAGVLGMLHHMISLIPIHIVLLAVASVWVGMALLREKHPQSAALKN
jgi:hypothetical protein